MNIVTNHILTSNSGTINLKNYILNECTSIYRNLYALFISMQYDHFDFKVIRAMFSFISTRSMFACYCN